MNKKLYYIILVILFSIIFTYIILFSETGYYKRKKLRHQMKNLKADNLEKTQKIEDLKIVIEKLKNENSYEIERLAREEYGMIKPNERYIELKE